MTGEREKRDFVFCSNFISWIIDCARLWCLSGSGSTAENFIWKCKRVSNASAG